jgi:hypothetical protein
MEHGIPGQEPRIVRSALNENLIAAQPQPHCLRDLAQATPGDHFIPGPSRYPVHLRHHTTGQMVRTRETRDTVRWLMSRLHHGDTPRHQLARSHRSPSRNPHRAGHSARQRTAIRT